MRDNVTLDFGEVLTNYFLFGLLLNILSDHSHIALFRFTIHQSPFNIHILDWSSGAHTSTEAEIQKSSREVKF